MNILRDQPRAFYMIFMLELWERFGFYTVQGIIMLYFIRYLGFNETQSYYIFGAFSALVYGLIIIGGYLGDKVLGTKRTLVLGLGVLALGYAFLAVADKNTAFWALSLICVGNGLFKANPSNLLSKCYKVGDRRLHGGFTLYYMAINLGSGIALIIGPSVAETYGYSYAYLLSAIGMCIGLANYWIQKKHVSHINTPADARSISIYLWLCVFMGIIGATIFSYYLLHHVGFAKNLLLTITLGVVIVYFYLMRHAQNASVSRMIVALVLMLEAVVFFTLYQQMPTSLNLFAINNVMPNLLGIHFDPQSFQALNPLWIITMSPMLAAMYRRKPLAVPYKFALGMTMCGISFSMLYFARYFYTDNGMVSSWWLVGSYLFQSLGELLVSALGVAMVAELVPAQIAGFVMGMWFLTSAVAGFIGAEVAAFTALPENTQPGLDSLYIYTHVFACIGLVTLAVAIVMWLLAPVLSQYMTKSHNAEKTSDEPLAFTEPATP